MTPSKEFLPFFDKRARLTAIHIRREREFSVVSSRFAVFASLCDCALCESILFKKVPLRYGDEFILWLHNFNWFLEFGSLDCIERGISAKLDFW